jgi:hypothetical protein
MADKAAEKPEKKPWMKWYWTDWKAGADLRSCSLAARGLWAEMLAIMDEAEPYGHLLINGKPLTPRALTNQVGGGASERQVVVLLKELEDAGVFSREDETHYIYCRRMVRDKAKADQDRENGLLGGNPRLKGSNRERVIGDAEPPGKPRNQTPPLTTPDKAQRPESRVQSPEAREAKHLVDDIVKLLDLDPQRCLVIGPAIRWLKDGATASEIIACCERLKPRLPTSMPNPLAYLDKAIPDELKKLRKDEGTEPISDELQALMCRVYYAIGTNDPRTGKTVAPWKPKLPENRVWSFDGSPPLHDSSNIRDAVAFAVIEELGLNQDEELKRVSNGR